MIEQLNYGYWAVGFVDLPGQKEAFMKADFIPDEKDDDGRQRLLRALKESIGVFTSSHSRLK